MSRSADIRKQKRQARLQLSDEQQVQHALALSRSLNSLAAFRNARSVAAYFAGQGEIDPAHALLRAASMGKQVYYPVLRPLNKNALWFAAIGRGGISYNRYGIPEPAAHHRKRMAAFALDLVLVPLVAFDRHCNRIGMGGGFYDRTFAFRNHRHHWKGPKLIGIAHECQKTDRIKPNTWDVGLDAVITEKQIYLP